MSGLWDDVLAAARRLTRTRRTSALTALVGGGAVAVNTAVFSLTNAVLLRPLPVREPDRLVRIWNIDRLERRGPLSMPTAVDWIEETGLFESLAATSLVLATAQVDPVPLRACALLWSLTTTSRRWGSRRDWAAS